MTPCASIHHRGETEADALASIGGRPPAPYCLDCIALAERRSIPTVITDLPPETPEMSPTFLPLILRPDADAHPELCRIDGCTKPIQARGLCMSDYSRVGNRGAWDAFALPKLSGPEIARKRAAEKLARAVAGDTGGDGRDTPPPTSETISEVPDALTAAPAPVVSEMETTAPVPVAEPVVLVAGRYRDFFMWPGHHMDVHPASIWKDGQGWRAALPGAVVAAPDHYATPEDAAASIGAVLPPAEPVLADPPRYVPAPAWAVRKLAADSADKSAALDEIRCVLAPVLGIGEDEDNAAGMVGRVAQRIEAQAVRIRFLEEEVAGVDDPLGLSREGRTRYAGDRAEAAAYLAAACRMYEAREKDLHTLLETGSVKYDDLCGAIEELKRKAEAYDFLLIDGSSPPMYAAGPAARAILLYELAAEVGTRTGIRKIAALLDAPTPVGPERATWLRVQLALEEARGVAAELETGESDQGAHERMVELIETIALGVADAE